MLLFKEQLIKAVPCMMCRRMILNARLHKVVATTNDENGMFTISVDGMRVEENEEYQKILDNK